MLKKKMMSSVLLSVFTAAMLATSTAHASLDDFLSRVNLQARADMNGFAVQVSAQFGVPEAQVRVVLGKTSSAADAFMIFQLGQWSRQPIDKVYSIYQKGKGRGWGALAQELGIKPGSPEFHALKRGDLQFRGLGQEQQSQGNGHGNGNGNGHGRGKNKNHD